MTFEVSRGTGATVTPPSTGTDWFVATNGLTGNTGATGSPWDLQTALSGGHGNILPGDRVNLKAGTYTGRYTCTLQGSSSKQITVMPDPAAGNWWTYPAKIDNGGGTLTTTISVNSNYVTYQDLEVLCSVGKRKSAQDGSSPTDLNSGSGFGSSSGGAVYTGNRIQNCLVHDTTDGIGIFTEGVNLVVYGNIVYNCGWDGATDRGHGHSLYMQNDAVANPGSTRNLSQNVMTNCFADEVNLFSQGSRVDNMNVDTDCAYSPAGASNLPSGSRTFLQSGGPHSTSPGMVSSHTNSIFYTPDFMPVVSTPNYFNGSPGEDDAPFASLQITNNSFLAFKCSVGAQFNGTFGGPNTLTGNTFLGTAAMGTDGTTITQANFPSNTYLTAKPGSNALRISPNAYHSFGGIGSCGNVVIMNWLHSASVAVDISTIVQNGKTYEVRDCSNYFGALVTSGTYGGGTINIPMNALTCAAPLGTAVPKTPVTCGPEFGAFRVVQTN